MRLTLTSAKVDETPVTFPPGRERLATTPLATGSVEAVITIGMDDVTPRAASTVTSQVAMITSGREPTTSRASHENGLMVSPRQKYSIWKSLPSR